MGVLLLVTIIAGIVLLSNIRTGGTDSRSNKQKWANEFEMDSYDDEQHWNKD